MSDTRPLRIGVSACFFHHDPTRPIFKGKRLLYVEESMLQWLLHHGALPVLIPTPHAGFSADHFLAEVDALLLQGGSDVSPQSYGEEALQPEWNGDIFRDQYEIDLIVRCMSSDKPVLGICRGHQMINVALGGSLYQDIELQVPGALVHRDWELYDRLQHEIALTQGSGLSELYRETGASRGEGGMILSIHHQAIKQLAPGLQVEATSVEDGIIEAVRLIAPPAGVPANNGSRPFDGELPYVVGVQWHPEFQRLDEPLLAPDPLMREFLRATRTRREKREKRIAAQAARQ